MREEGGKGGEGRKDGYKKGKGERERVERKNDVENTRCM